MRRRWLKLALALVPVLYIPSCVATQKVLVALERDSAAAGVKTTFPVLVVRGSLVDIVPYQSGIWSGSDVSLKAANRVETAAAVAKLKAATLPAEVDHFDARVEIEDLPNAMQRVHLHVQREVAMGIAVSESWYETDGRRLVPLEEREYPLSWMWLEAMVLAVPVTLAIAAAASSRFMRSPGRPAT